MARLNIRRMVGRLILVAMLTVISVFWIFPFVWMISAGFKTNPEIISGLSLFPDRIRLEPYARAWTQGRFEAYFMNTVVVSVITVLIVVVTCAMAGYTLGRRSIPGKKLLVGLLVTTMFIPQSFVIIPIYDLLSRLGLLNSIWGVILAIVGSSHVMFIMLFAGQFAQVPQELEHSAMIDGCGFFRVFYHIMMPAALPIVASVIIFQFIQSWNAFLIPLIMTLGKPSLRTLGVGLYAFVGEYTSDWAGLAAGASITVIPIIIVFFFVQRFFVDGLAGAIKG
jgi:raffinose/stachyose/melibiose transport system permease protein